jgi:hypothetical protein
MHLPYDSRIAIDPHTTPLKNSGFAFSQYYSLATNRTLKNYMDEGIKYLMVSSYIYELYFAEPERYPHEARFHNQLFKQEKLIAAFTQPDCSPVLGSGYIRTQGSFPIAIPVPRRLLCAG